jgi:AraC family ethanolamine operon transcriptional activator
MNVVRRALSLADPTAKTVTEIANDHGFAELGRFAGAYRNLFGEAPSMTLRRMPDDRLLANTVGRFPGRLAG